MRQELHAESRIAGATATGDGSYWVTAAPGLASSASYGEVSRQSNGFGDGVRLPAPLVIAGALRGFDETRRLPSNGQQVLRRTAELANAAVSLREGARTVHQYLAEALGWLPSGWRAFGNQGLVSRQFEGEMSCNELLESLAADEAGWPEQRQTTQLIALKVEHAGRVAAVLAFQRDRRGATAEQCALLAAVGQQLAVLAQRDASQQSVLAREFEILRQGQLAGMAELAQGLSHELSQPLTALAAYAGALQRRLEKGQGDHDDIAYLGERLVQQVTRAGHILQATKSFVLQRTCTTGSVDVETTIRHLKGLVQAPLEAASVELSVEIASGLPPARGSESHVVQIVLSLLTNSLSALKSVATARKIAIRVIQVGREVRISVADGGCHSIEQPIEDQQPFYAAYADSARVGLAISRSLVEIQGGRLWKEQRDGETTFSVSLPVIH